MDRWFPMISVGWQGILGLLALVVLLVLASLIGPMVVLLAWLIQRWAAAEPWNARDRWASVGGFALFFGIIVLIEILSLTPSVPLFPHFLATLWHRLHAPGEYVLGNLMVRWALSLPLSPALAIAFEYIHPRTVWYPSRALLPSERAQLQAQAEAERAASFAKTASSATVTEPPRTAQRTPRSLKTPSPIKKETTRVERTDQPTTREQKQPVVQEIVWTTDQVEGSMSTSGQNPPVPEKRKSTQPQLPKKKHDWDKGEGSLKDL